MKLGHEGENYIFNDWEESSVMLLGLSYRHHRGMYVCMYGTAFHAHPWIGRVIEGSNNYNCHFWTGWRYILIDWLIWVNLKGKSLFVEEREGSHNAHFSNYTIQWQLWWSWINYLILHIVWIHQVRNVNGTIWATCHGYYGAIMFQLHGFDVHERGH